MKKFALAGICTLALVGFVMADEFTATITKVEGNTVYFKKKAGFGGGGKKGAPATDVKEEKADAASDVKVAKGEIDFGGAGAGAGGKKGGGKGTGKGAGGFALNVKAGDPIPGGLKAETFTKIDTEKGVFAQITTNDAGKITQILAVEGGFGGGKKGGGFTGKGGKKGG